MTLVPFSARRICYGIVITSFNNTISIVSPKLVRDDTGLEAVEVVMQLPGIAGAEAVLLAALHHLILTQLGGFRTCHGNALDQLTFAKRRA